MESYLYDIWSPNSHQSITVIIIIIMMLIIHPPPPHHLQGHVQECQENARCTVAFNTSNQLFYYIKTFSFLINLVINFLKGVGVRWLCPTLNPSLIIIIIIIIIHHHTSGLRKLFPLLEGVGKEEGAIGRRSRGDPSTAGLTAASLWAEAFDCAAFCGAEFQIKAPGQLIVTA